LIVLKGNAKEIEVSSIRNFRQAAPFLTANEWYRLKARVDVARWQWGDPREGLKKLIRAEAWTIEVPHNTLAQRLARLLDTCRRNNAPGSTTSW
jgi:hypothetical protein